MRLTLAKLLLSKINYKLNENFAEKSQRPWLQNYGSRDTNPRVFGMLVADNVGMPHVNFIKSHVILITL